MDKKFFVFVIAFTLLFNAVIESAFARAGGRSSFSGGRSSTSYSSQGSRGSRTYEGGSSSNGRKYAPMERSATGKNSENSANPNYAQNSQPNAAGNFFQRNPFLTTVGAVLAGSWLGHMIFGNSGFAAGAAGAGNSAFLINMILMIIGAIFVVALVKFMTRRNYASYNNHSRSGGDFSRQQIVKISLPDFERQNFSKLLIEIQTAWSGQDMVTLKRLLTSEMSKYFSDLLAQNNSQGIANKVEDIEVTFIEITEAWKEGEMEYATAMIEWSSYDYMINLNKNPRDADYIVEGGDKNLVMNSEAWTFVRYGSSGRWILSAIAQVE